MSLMEAPVAQWPGFPRSEWPDIRWTTDPTDYARPIAFDPKERSWRRDDDSRWPNWDKQNRVRQFCST
jgi:hypothetical protein